MRQRPSPCCFLASATDGSYVLVFLGTANAEEWATDALIQQTQNKGAAGGNVHTGFSGHYQAVADAISTAVASLPADGKMTVVGHSLGAAVAELAAADHAAVVSAVYTMGCPRVGDPTYAAGFDGLGFDSYRITNAWDIVPAMPAKMVAPTRDQITLYQHAGQQCPVYSSELEFVSKVKSDPFFGHYVTTYQEALQAFPASGG